MKLIQGDCLEKMKEIESGSCDMVLTDPPYGTTSCKWDSIIPLEPMWEQLKRVIKANGAIVLFGSEPFSSALRMSNIKNYKYDSVWHKNQPSGMLSAAYRPMKAHEIISVFNSTFYYPIKIKRTESELKRLSHKSVITTAGDTLLNYKTKTANRYDNTIKNPISVLNHKCVFNRSKEKVAHPTQKPVALMEYLIKTYTNEGETVLDFTMGSGTTGVACANLNRDFIGIELDPGFFKIAQDRISTAIVGKPAFIGKTQHRTPSMFGMGSKIS